MRRFVFSAMIALSGLSAIGCGSDKAKIEKMVEGHMVGEAMLAAHFVAAAEQSGMDAETINGILRNIADNSGIDEFWITDSEGHAYLTNTGVDFTFSRDPKTEPQASAFWPLIEGKVKVVTQEARVREIDNRVFKYVGVAGIDKPRIVQIGMSAEDLVP